MPGWNPEARWAGRSYAHFVLSAPLLGEPQIQTLDGAVCAKDGWQPVPADDDSLVEQGGPVLSRRWRRGERELRLSVLGWYPVLATIGSPGRATSSSRSALERVFTAVRIAGGRPISDEELPRCLTQVQARWEKAVDAQRRLEAIRPWLEFRECGQCGGWTGQASPHCRVCGHRFTSGEDVQRDERRRRAAGVVDECTAELTALGRGDGLLPGWPPRPRAPRTDAPSSMRRVVV